MKNLEIAKKYEDYMISLRRHFHENPELSGQEFETVKRIDAELTEMGVEHVVIENGGVLATIRGTKDNGKTVLLRADCDALPVLEKDNLANNRTCWSKVDGVMHACGHDAHTSMLLGAAKVLLEKRDEIEGTVYLCFERGEEFASNFEYIFPYMEKHGIKVDSCFGLHTNVTMETGKIAINDNDVLAGAMAFDITIEGRGGHGSRPDQAINPIDCFTAINTRLQMMRLTMIDPFKTCTYSIGKLNAGIQQNVIPQTLNFAGTMRCFDSDGVGMKFHDEFKRIVDTVCQEYNCKVTYNNYSMPGFATVNDEECARFASKVLAQELGAENICKSEPQMGSESFSYYLKQWPGVFGLLGVHNPEKGTGAANHNERFDIDEASLVYGAACHATYAIEFLKSDFVTTHRKKYTYKECMKLQGKEDQIPFFYGE